jgi:4-alpha-glucanotransferase
MAGVDKRTLSSDIRRMSDPLPLFSRASGILLHPTSLPGRLGIGNIGAPARAFVDWLADAGQSWWQMLPLGPTAYGDSPYQTLSTFAANPLLVDLEALVGDGWLADRDLEAALAADREAAGSDLPQERVDYGRVGPLVRGLLARAWDGFRRHASVGHRREMESWCAAHADWLEDYALFVALSERHEYRPWNAWPAGERRRDAAALRAARAELAGPIGRLRFEQWIFHRQWSALREYATEHGVRLLGDIPIFVAHGSSDVWAHPDLFQLDGKGLPTAVAGVPPDYFSRTGQRWGNPLYDWDALSARGYDWWIARFRAVLDRVDAVRLDHFRGFEAYWRIPAQAETAVIGEWVPAPGVEFLSTLREALRDHAGRYAADLPIVAEDLGMITPAVEELRDRFALPGMKILQFAWSDPKNPFLPHAHVRNAVVYTGTHDNNTTVGWWREEVQSGARRFLAEYLGRENGAGGLIEFDREPNWALIRLGMMSVAHTFIMPMQDVLGLGAEARLNTPSRPEGNWRWRIRPDQLDGAPHGRLAEMTRLYRRLAIQQLPEKREDETGD